MQDKLKILQNIFGDTKTEDTADLPGDAPVRAPLSHGKFYGGVYNGRKYMYSELMITTMSPDRLEAYIKKQIGYQTED